MMGKLFGAIVVLLSFSGVLSVHAQEDTDPAVREFVEKIEETHGKNSWPEGKILKAKVNVQFGDVFSPLIGELYMSRDFAKNHFVQAESLGNVEAWYADGKAWAAPADAEFNGAHFMLPTVAYFLGAPFKLSDPGVKIEVLEKELPMDGKMYPAAKMTFAEDVGDAPDDWYILYRNPETGVLEGMPYIVTYGKSAEEAEGRIKMIVYGDYTTVGETPVQLSQNWKFFEWNEEEGPHGDAVFVVNLSEFSFVDPEPNQFQPSDSAKNVTPEHMQ